MKKFILSILSVAIFFIGLGGVIQETGARFKSDERALTLIKQAQTAIGGEKAVREIKSMTISAQTSKTLDIDGAARVEQGEMEINLGFPNQFSKRVKFGGDNLTAAQAAGVVKRVVVITQEKGENTTFKSLDPNAKIGGVFKLKQGNGETMVMKSDGVDGEITKLIAGKNVNLVRGNGFHQNEFFRTTLALLLTAPQGTDITFTYAGEGDVDGNSCDIVEAKGDNSTVKLFLDKSSHLPKMMSYQGFKPMILKISENMKNDLEADAKVSVNKFEKPEAAEIQIRFSDYRNVNGVLLPYQWTQTIGGNADETVNVSSYEINPANIAERLQTDKPPALLYPLKKSQ